jgi:ankyrin repeat protein
MDMGVDVTFVPKWHRLKRDIGDTILHRAVENGHLEIITWCLKMKCDPLIRDKRGKLAVEKAKNDKIKHLLKDGN